MRSRAALVAAVALELRAREAHDTLPLVAARVERVALHKDIHAMQLALAATPLTSLEACLFPPGAVWVDHDTFVDALTQLFAPTGATHRDALSFFFGAMEHIATKRAVAGGGKPKQGGCISVALCASVLTSIWVADYSVIAKAAYNRAFGGGVGGSGNGNNSSEPLTVAGFTFRSNFCSGNLASVKDRGKRADGTQIFEITLRPDGTTAAPTAAQTWFHFAVAPGVATMATPTDATPITTPSIATQKSKLRRSCEREILRDLRGSGASRGGGGGSAATAGVKLRRNSKNRATAKRVTPNATKVLNVEFRIANFSDHTVLYSQGMRVITRTLPRSGPDGHAATVQHGGADDENVAWTRCASAATCEKQRDTSWLPTAEPVSVLSWVHSFDDAARETFFAFCYPHSFEESQAWLSKIVRDNARDNTDTTAEMEDSENRIYVCRETLEMSSEGRPVELLTISSVEGMSDEYDIGIAEGKARRFPTKPIVFISARVHPGDTPSSYVMLGLVDLVLRQTSAVCDADRAAIDTVREAAAIGMNSSFPTPTPALAAARSGKYKLAAQRAAKAAQLAGRAFRKHFVLKVVPMLNPDGVARGLHRCNARGEDMNRSYLAPDAARHPVVSAVRNALTKWVSQGEQVALFADLHAHTKKRGVFVFGNELQSAESQVENILFPKLVALHTQHFDFRASVFGRMDVAGRRDHIWSQQNHTGVDSSAGSGRVALFRATGLIRCYTLMANFNGGAVANALAPGVAFASSAKRGRQRRLVIPTHTAVGGFDDDVVLSDGARSDSRGATKSLYPPAPPTTTPRPVSPTMHGKQMQKQMQKQKQRQTTPTTTKKMNSNSNFSKQKQKQKQMLLPTAARSDPTYGPLEWSECGRGLIYGVLELYGVNPVSRLPRSKFKKVAAVRAELTSIVAVSRWRQTFSQQIEERNRRALERGPSHFAAERDNVSDAQKAQERAEIYAMNAIMRLWNSKQRALYLTPQEKVDLSSLARVPMELDERCDDDVDMESEKIGGGANGASGEGEEGSGKEEGVGMGSGGGGNVLRLSDFAEVITKEMARLHV